VRDYAFGIVRLTDRVVLFGCIMNVLAIAFAADGLDCSLRGAAAVYN
jgi:hypothetical protein